MAETDVRDSPKQATSNKYQPYLTYGLLAFIGGLLVFTHFIEQVRSHFLGLHYLDAFSIFLSLITIGISMFFSRL